MPSSDGRPLSRRRTLLAGAGVVGTASGYRLLSADRETETVTRRLGVEDERDVDEIDADETELESTGADGGSVSQRCESDPERWRTGTRSSNLTSVDFWNERYWIWGSEAEAEDDGHSGVDVQNALWLTKAPERIDGSYLYGVRLHSRCVLEDETLSRLRLRRLEQELTVDSDLDVRAVLPSSPVTPEDGRCTVTMLTELPSGSNAGYEQYWSVDEGTIETEHVDDTVTLSYDGETSDPVTVRGIFELRTERPISEFSEPLEWTVRGEATRRGP